MNNNTSFKSIAEAFKKRNERNSPSPTINDKQENADTSIDSSKKPIVNAFNKYNNLQGNSNNEHINPYIKQTNTNDTNTETVINKRKPTMVNVSKSQKGNPVLDLLTSKNIPWQYVSSTATTKILYDYSVRNNKRMILFLSLKYHKLHPEYIFKKMKPLQQQNCILLILVDIEQHEQILKDLNRICLYNGFTILMGWNYEQCGKYVQFLA